MNKIGDERMKGSLSLRGFRKLRTGAIVATGVFLIGLASVQTTVQASEEDGVWVARTVEQVKADIQKEDNFFKYEIKWGDTLSVISEATDIPVDVLKEMNRVSDRNLFLPHNELLYTEGESVTDSKTKLKIVIKESYGKKEVRTYEVVLQKNHGTAEVTFELKETTEKVQASNKSVVSYCEVYNLVSDQVEGTVETPGEKAPATPGTTETPAPVQPAEEKPATSGATETPTPAQPAEEQPAAPGATETPADSNNQNNPNEPKDDVEKGLEENGAELESRKKIKLEEINSSSLSSSEKEAAKLKVEEYTKKAKEEMKQAKTTDDQAAVVEKYSDDLITIDTPGVDQGKPDYTNSGLSGNGPEGTNIGDNNVIGHGNSTPENTGFRSAPVYQPRVTLRERNADELKNKVSIYYNYDGMKDIPGFFNDLDSKNEVEVPQKVPAQTLKSILKSKIDQKKAELERKGYKIADEYFVGINQENATHYDYVVTFTKA